MTLTHTHTRTPTTTTKNVIIMNIGTCGWYVYIYFIHITVELKDYLTVIICVSCALLIQFYFVALMFSEFIINRFDVFFFFCMLRARRSMIALCMCYRRVAHTRTRRLQRPRMSNNKIGRQWGLLALSPVLLLHFNQLHFGGRMHRIKQKYR